MNRIITLLAALLLVLPLTAQSRYSVYKTKGTVKLCPKTEKTWVDVQRKQDLQLGDRLQLQDASAITILDNTNNLLYPYDTPGECTVMEAVRSARNKAGSRTSAVNAEMKRSIEGHGNAPSYDVLGASYRGQGEASYTDSLAAFVRQFAQAGISASKLSLTLVQQEDAMVFQLCNGADIPLYVNVLRIKGDEINVCLDFDGKEGSEGILLDAGAQVVLDQYPFLEQEGARYQAFGTVRSYDTRSLQRALKRGNTQDALTTGFVL